MKKLLQLSFLLLTFIAYSQQLEFEVFNTSINSKYAELGIVFLDAENVLFASSKKTENDRAFASNRRVNNRYLFLEFYFGKLNDSSDIIQTNRLSKEIFTKFNESDLALSPDRKTIFFCWNNYYIDQPKDANVKQKAINLFRADIDSDYNLSNIAPVRFNSKNYSIKTPYVSRDGSKLFFISNMPGGFGNYDIYVSNILDDGSLSWPKNLGNKVNTSSNDLYPFSDENNTLYFASYGHKGKGNLDIFKSEFINGNYTEVENLPGPINSKYDDFGYTTNPKGTSGFFISNRKKGKGDVDIYGFTIIDKEIECNQLITGLISDKDTQKPIANANLTLYSNNEPIDSIASAKDGSYMFKLKCNESYKITAAKEHFIGNEVDFETDETKDAELIKDIDLIAIPCNQSINGIVTNKLTNELLQDVTIKLYSNGEEISKITTNIDALYNFELICNSDYIIIVEKEGYFPIETTLKINSNFNEELTKNIALTPLPCIQIVTGIVSNKLTGEPLINSNLKIYKNDKLITSEILRSRSYFKTELECETKYKFIAQKEGFLDAEININTNNQLDYNFTKNIELTPIECNQLISGTVTNKQTGELLNNVTVKLFKNNQLIESQLIENNSNYSFNVDCNENYKIIAEKERFEPFEISVKTDSNNDFNHNKNIGLTPLPCNQIVSGIITNVITGETLVNVSLKLKSNKSETETIKNNSNSEFRFNLKCDETYTITAQKEGFLDAEININTNNQLDYNFTKNIELTPIECNQLISGTVTNKQTGELLNNVTVKLFKNNQLIESQLIENNSNYSFNVDCNENYKIIAEKERFEPFEISVKTDSNNDFNHNKNIGLTPLFCNQILTGIIVDESTGNKLSNLQISLFQNNRLKETINLKTLQFKFNLNCSESFKILVEKTNYESAEVIFSTNDINGFNIEKIIHLKPLKCTQTINGEVLDQKNNLPITSAGLTVSVNNVKLKDEIVDANGNFNLELDCNLEYQITAFSEGYEKNSIIINPTTNYAEITNKTIYLTSQDEVFEIVRNQKMVKTNPIYFDLDKSNITPLAAAELDKVVAVLINYPNFKIETKSHTDSRGPDNYNFKLSNRRASSTISYIISKGIDPSRIYGKGYGETEIINRCANGVRCTEKEHQLNRRTEFIVIEEQN